MTDEPSPKKPADDATLILGTGDDATVIVNESDRQHTTGGIPAPAPSGNKALRVLNERFELIALLGRGAMGHVYKAIDRRKVEANDKDPYVAIKLLTEEFQKHPDAFVTLQREARKAQNLSSEYIVKVFDFDRDGDTIYMTMEYLEGLPLDELIAKNKDTPLERDAIWKLLDGTCEALGVAHRARIVHSDLKPGNIFVTADGEAKLLDFGIARAVIDKGADVASNATEFDAGSLGALTPAYASLEMFSGAQPDPRDDIYALGCIAYELLSGEHPYQRTTAEQAAKLGATPKRIAGLNNAQWKALKGALAFERDKRIATVEDFEVQLIPGKRRRGSLLSTLVAAVVSAAVVGGILYTVMPDGGEVAAQAQQDVDNAFTEAMLKARSCRDKQDFVCAKDNVDIALKLHSDNAEARTLAGQVQQLAAEYRSARVSELITSADTCSAEQDYECASTAIAQALKLWPDHEPLLLRRTEIDAGLARSAQLRAQIAALEADANACMAADDIACVRGKIAQLLEIAPKNQLAADLSQQLADAKAAALQAKIDGHINRAQTCFNQNQLSCADREIKASLALDPGNAAARALSGSVEAARAKAAEDRRRVNLFISEAQTCFEQKRYSCTLAKTEAALAINSNSRAAADLHARAEAAQAAAKKRIKIE